MDLAPERRAIFRHLRFKKCSEHAVFCTFWLAYLLRATAACDFWTSELHRTSKMAPELKCFVHFDLQMRFAPQGRAMFRDRHFRRISRPCGVLCILTCKCALCHSGVPFFISLLNRYLRTRRFSEPTFRTSGTTNHWKNTAIRDFPNIWRVCIFFLVTLLACWSSFCRLDFSTLLFNFPYCRKLVF